MYLRQHITHGTLFSFRDVDDIKNHIVRFPSKISVLCNIFTTCFDPFWSAYKSDRKFYFAFPVMPEWINEFVDEFNSEFKNIKIEIVDNKVVYYSEKTSLYSVIPNLTKIKPEEYLYELSQPIFTINFSNDYSINTKRYTSYIIHHILRLLSLAEGFIEVGEKPDINYLDFIVHINNNRRKKESFTRSVSDNRITKEQLLNLDNLKLVNMFDEIARGIIKQTGIISMFDRIKVILEGKDSYIKRFKIGDFVSPALFLNSGIMNDLYFIKIGEIIDILPDSLLKIKLIEHRYDPSIYREYGSLRRAYEAHIISDCINFHRVYRNGRKANAKRDRGEL